MAASAQVPTVSTHTHAGTVPAHTFSTPPLLSRLLCWLAARQQHKPPGSSVDLVGILYIEKALHMP